MSFSVTITWFLQPAVPRETVLLSCLKRSASAGILVWATVAAMKQLAKSNLQRTRFTLLSLPHLSSSLSGLELKHGRNREAGADAMAMQG